MAKELTEEELCGVKDLEEKFTEHLERYRVKKVTEHERGASAELQEELEGLEEYHEGCRNSEIDDLLINIEFCAAKIGVLRRILELDK